MDTLRLKMQHYRLEYAPESFAGSFWMLKSLFKGQVLFVIRGSRYIARWPLIFPNSLRSCLPAEVGFPAPRMHDMIFVSLLYDHSSAYCLLFFVFPCDSH